MSWLIVGLGNYGQAYAYNRHNIGFMAVDFLLQDTSAIKICKNSLHSELFKTKSTNSFYLKPLTFMNNSGKAVIAVKQFYKINQDKILVIHDDIDLPFGTLRYKQAGFHAGHNGLKSIDETIGKDYIRARLGIGRPNHKSQINSFVLGNFSTQEQEQLKNVFDSLKQAIFQLIEGKALTQIKSLYTLNNAQ